MWKTCRTRPSQEAPHRDERLRCVRQLKPGQSCEPMYTITSFKGIKGQNISVQEAILIAQIQKAMKGDTRAAEYVRDSIGQKPSESMNMAVNLPVFFEGEDNLEE